MFLKPKNKEGEKKKNFKDRVFTSFNTGFDAFQNRYLSLIKPLIQHKWVSMLVLVGIAGVTYVLMASTPKAFIPTEDDSFLTYSITMPPGASLSRTKKTLAKADSILSLRDDIDGRTSISGYNGIDANASPSFAVGYINLKPYNKRGKVKDINKIMESILNDLSQIHEASFQVFPRPTIQGFGDFSGVEF